MEFARHRQVGVLAVSLLLGSASSFRNTTRSFSRISSPHRTKSPGFSTRIRMRRGASAGAREGSKGWGTSQSSTGGAVSLQAGSRNNRVGDITMHPEKQARHRRPARARPKRRPLKHLRLNFWRYLLRRWLVSPLRGLCSHE